MLIFMLTDIGCFREPKRNSCWIWEMGGGGTSFKLQQYHQSLIQQCGNYEHSVHRELKFFGQKRDSGHWDTEMQHHWDDPDPFLLGRFCSDKNRDWGTEELTLSCRWNVIWPKVYLEERVLPIQTWYPALASVNASDSWPGFITHISPPWLQHKHNHIGHVSKNFFQLP